MADFARGLALVDVTIIAGDILARNTDKVKDANINQLMQGLDRFGRPLSPKFSEDPYFKKPGAWQRYAAWKQRLFPETPYDTPNLIIRGDYHDSIKVIRTGDNITFDASIHFAGDVSAKYQDKQLGLNQDSKVTIWNEVIQPAMVKQICNLTGAKSK
jgi:hypothetical protein